ncbi:DNA helicase PIF1, ATP-dependent [Tanacetum coccineum]
MAPETATAEPQLFLENLELGVTGTIVLMLCRMWDVYAATGRYLSTDFVVCDSKGSMMHATARGSIEHNFLKLKEDAAGYVTNVGRNVQQKTGSKMLDFHLANSRCQSVRVTLWGSLGELLIEKRTNHVGVYPIVLTRLIVKQYNSQLYLSSTSSTLILDDEEIPEVKHLKADSSGAEFSKEILPVGCSEAKAETLENLLIGSRNQIHDSTTFHCTVHKDNVRTRNGWNFPSFGGKKCKKSVTHSNGRFLCESCKKNMDYPVLRYKLELEVSDDTTEVVVVMFNETTTSLVKCPADSIMKYEDHQADEHSPLPQALASIVGTSHTLEFKSKTYYEHNTYESFTCWRIVTTEGMGESGGSSMAGGNRASETPEFKRLLRHPSVTTPSKVDEVKKQKRGEDKESDVEASFVADTQTASGVGGSRPDMGDYVRTQERTKCVLRMTVLRVRQTPSCSIPVTAKLMDMDSDCSTIKNAAENHSLANILQHCVTIQSNTIVRQDGRVQSYCGLQLKGIGTSILSTSAIPDQGRTNLYQQSIASTSNFPFSDAHRPKTGATTKCKSRNTTKGVAFTSRGTEVSYHNIGAPSYQCAHCNASMWYEERINKGNRAVNPSFSLCYQEGKLRLPKFNPTPQPLHNLLDYNDAATTQFGDQIRVYNSMFSFTSFGARIDHSINNGRGVYTFRVNRQSYHRIGSLLPKKGTQPRYAQLWFFDTGNEARNHMGAFIDKDNSDSVDATTVQSFTQMLDQYSLVAKAFWMARDWCHSHASVNVELHLLSERTNTRNYNKPTAAEVAALITKDFGDGIPSRDIIVNKLHSRPKRISELHPAYMALQYPLLFPYGEDDFHKKIPYYTNRGNQKTNRWFVTMKEYYSYIIQQRNDQGNTLVRGGHLFQQYLVDAYSAIEEQCLKWTRNNQDTLRVDLYHNVCDVVTRGDTNEAGLGQRIVLPDSSKCKTAAQIDDIILAELPSSTDDPDGYKAVTDYMLHGPCGKDGRYAPCTTEGKCSKHYPKQFYAETVLDEDGYPIYRRWDNKASFKKGKFTFDNRNVVPHNRYILLKYQAHINVEWCNRSKVIKYLFKYLNKVLDRATVVIQENVRNGDHVTSEKVVVDDEINNYLNCRYLAPCEAAWRLFSFDIHYSYMFVMKLNFHLPNQNPVTLRDSKFLPALLEKEGINVTMFTYWFDLNERDPSARTLTYAELPKLYVWHEQGLKDFDELMMVSNRLCHTLKEACFAYGLLNDDREWTKAISEASLWALGPQLRNLFITILLFCDVSRPLKLWEETWEFLFEDILHRKRKLYEYPELQLSIEQIHNYCLHGDEYLKEWAILTPRNDDVDENNNNMFNKLVGKFVTYNSADEVCKASTESQDQQQLYPTEILNTLNFSGMPPHALCLKKELPIMLLRNVNPTKGLCNGTRLIITGLGLKIYLGLDLQVVSKPGVSTTFTSASSSPAASSNVIENVLHSFVTESDPQQQITYEDFDQIGKLDLDELDIDPFQVTPKTSHLLAVKRIFRYLKGKPTLGLWYSRDSPFELVAYTDSDYAGATQDSYLLQKVLMPADFNTLSQVLECGILNFNPVIYTSVFEQFWQYAKALRIYLHLDDIEGIDCLPTATIFEELGNDDDLMFDTGVLEDDEMHVEAKDEQSTKPDDSTAGEVVTTASDQVSSEFHKRDTTSSSKIKEKHMGGYTYKQLKGKSFDEIQKLFDKEMKRVNTIMAMGSKVQESKEKKVEGREETAKGSRKKML